MNIKNNSLMGTDLSSVVANQEDMYRRPAEAIGWSDVEINAKLRDHLENLEKEIFSAALLPEKDDDGNPILDTNGIPSISNTLTADELAKLTELRQHSDELSQRIYKSMGLSSKLIEGVSPLQHERVMHQQQIDSEVTKAIQRFTEEELIMELLEKTGRSCSDKKIQKLLDLFYQETDSPMTLEQVQIAYNEDLENGSLEKLVDLLEGVPGVKRVTIMTEDLDSATITVRRDMRRMNDKEIYDMSILLQQIIEDHKPPRLDELEVIYHNVEVY